LAIKVHNPSVAAAIKIHDEESPSYPEDLGHSGLVSTSGANQMAHLSRRNSQCISFSFDRNVLQKAGDKAATTVTNRSPRAPTSQNRSLESTGFNIVVGKPAQPLQYAINTNVPTATPPPHATKLETTDSSRFKLHSLIGGNLILNEDSPVGEQSQRTSQL